MISINATLLLQLIQFLVLVYILNRLMFKPILKILDERKKYLSDSRLKINNIEVETKDLVNKCISIESQARKDAARKSSEYKNEGLATAESIFDEAKEEVMAIKNKVRKEMDTKLETARQSLQSEAVLLSDVIIEKVVGRRISS